MAGITTAGRLVGSVTAWAGLSVLVLLVATRIALPHLTTWFA